MNPEAKLKKVARKSREIVHWLRDIPRIASNAGMIGRLVSSHDRLVAFEISLRHGMRPTITLATGSEPT